MSNASLIARQVRFANKAFWRNPPAAFFTFAFPLLFLVIFTTLFGGSGRLVINGNRVSVATFYISSIIVFSVITACYTNVAMTLTFARELGILKRVRGTPLPGWAYLLGRMLHSVLMAVLLVVICVAFGMAFYGARVSLDSLGPLLLTLSIGAASFCLMGMAVTTVVPNADAAPAVVNATMLPLLFVSDVFIPLQNPPAWIDLLGKIFPVRHFSDAMQYAFFPPAGTIGLRPVDLAVVGAWGLLGLFVAVKRFSWEPKK
ncbi:MAG: ABC transporter permease [Actinomycetota bacterium]